MHVRIKKHIAVDEAIELLEKIQVLNEFEFMDELTIVLDYSIADAGYYSYDAKDKRDFGGEYDEVYANPNNCSIGNKQYGYTDDCCLKSTIIHEFCHYLDRRMKIRQAYEKAFPLTSLFLNSDSKDCVLEEICEIMVLYVTNPYLLKHIGKERFQFISEYFISPTECTARKFAQIWKTWPVAVRKKCRIKWEIWFRAGELHTL